MEMNPRLRPNVQPQARPHVVANFAMTLDGKVSTRERTPSLFTSARDKKRLAEIRALGDALLVGRGTVEADTMSMGLSSPALRKEREERGQAPYPLRAVVSAAGNFDPQWKIFHSPGGRVLLFSSAQMPEGRRHVFLKNPEVDLFTPLQFCLGEVLRILRKKYKVRTLVCEGGAMLFRALVALRAVDELYVTIAPRLFGGRNAPTLTGSDVHYMAPELPLRLCSFFAEGDEWFLHYRARRHRCN